MISMSYPLSLQVLLTPKTAVAAKRDVFVLAFRELLRAVLAIKLSLIMLMMSSSPMPL